MADNYLTQAIQAFNGQVDNAKKAAQWLWELLQGDFNENQTPEQVITNAGISITLSATGVGVVLAWILDLRDFVACVYLIHKEGSKSGSFKAKDVSFLKWFLLVIMLVGLIPALGDLLKGVLRIIYLEFKAIAKTAANLPIAKQFGMAIDNAMPYIEKLLRHEKLRQYLSKMGWHRPFKEMAKALKDNYSAITSLDKLIKIYNDMIGKFKQIYQQIKGYLPAGSEKKFQEILKVLNEVRDGLVQKAPSLERLLKECMDVLIIKLEKKGMYEATSGRFANHYYCRSVVGTRAYEEAKKLPFLGKYENYRPLPKKNTSYNTLLKRHQGTGTSLDLAGQDWLIPTFAGVMKVRTIEGPATLYRVIDPISGVDASHWVTEEVFKQLKTRNQWRDKLAVRVDWNANGQYVTMKIPDGQEMKVYSGPAASQAFDDDKLTGLYYGGGAEQIVFNARNVDFPISARKETNWGYTDNDVHYLLDRVIINLNGSAKK